MLKLLVILILIFATILFFIGLVIPTIRSLIQENKKASQKDTNSDSLIEQIKDAKKKVDEVKKVQENVTDHFKTVEEIKADSDKLLK